MDMTRLAGATHRLKSLQYFALEGGTKAFRRRQSVLQSCIFEVMDRRNPKFIMQLYCFIRAQPWNGHQVQRASRRFATQLFKSWVAPCSLELADHCGNGVADPWDFSQTVLSYKARERVG